MFYDFIINSLTNVKPVVEIGIIAYVFYKFYLAVSNTKAEQMIKLILGALAIFALSYLLKLNIITWILEKSFVPFIIFLVVIFQQELRRAFTPIWSGRKSLFKLGEMSLNEQIDIVLNACNVLISKKRGALIVFPKNISIKNVIESGTKLNADLSQSLILTVFDHDTPLHDGAMVISESRIQAAGCYLPLSDQNNISKSFGTRHKAALGLSEESDAIILVVSEERGTITICYNANIHHNLSREDIKRIFLMQFSSNETTSKEEDIINEIE